MQRAGGTHRVGSEPCQARDAHRDARRQHAQRRRSKAGHGSHACADLAGAPGQGQEGKACHAEDSRRRKQAHAAAARSHHLRDAGRRRSQHVGNDQQRRGAEQRRQRGRETPAARRPRPRQRETGPEPGVEREPGRAGSQAEPGRGGAVLPERISRSTARGVAPSPRCSSTRTPATTRQRQTASSTSRRPWSAVTAARRGQGRSHAAGPRRSKASEGLQSVQRFEDLGRLGALGEIDVHP